MPVPSRSPIRPVRLGYVPLADAAPLLVADQLGLFERQGINVILHREVGWATIREKILHGELDAAHAPAGLALSLRLGVHGQQVASLVPLVLNAHGNAITLSRHLHDQGVRCAASLLKLARSNPSRLLTFGVVALWSSHHILLRDWLASGGIHPDRDVRIIMIPPPQMAGSLAAGLLDGYCAGEPWNTAAILNGTGWCPATSESIAPGHPEKVLLTTEDFAAGRPADLSALLRALLEACHYCDTQANRSRLPSLLTNAFHRAEDRDLLSHSLIGPFQTGVAQVSTDRFHIFHRDGVNRPSPSQADWLLRGFSRHGIIPTDRLEEARQAMKTCWSSAWFDRAQQPRPPKRRAKAVG